MLDRLPALLLGILANRGRIAAASIGAAWPLCFAPFGLWWLTPLLLALLALAWEGQLARERFWRGLWFGSAAFSTGTYWLYISIHGFGGAPPPLAIGAMLALIVLMALYFAVAGALSARLARAPGSVRLMLVFPGIWAIVEWSRGWLFSGFPWLSAGYSATNGFFAGWAPIVGVHGTSLAIAVVAGAVAALVSSASGRRSARVVPIVVIVAIVFAGSVLSQLAWTRPAGTNLKVSLVQGGISQERKWRADELETTKKLFLDLTVPLSDSDLIVWPEAAIPALAHEAPEFLGALAELAKARKQQLILGILTFDFATGVFRNSLLAQGQETGTYHKRHLVPFGEYFPVPNFVRETLRLLDLPYQDITPGGPGQRPLMAKGVPMAPSICYEDVFGNEMREFLPEAQLLINVSNDGWFGDSIAPHQHLQMARFRALESRRYMLRSTNTGITAIIDPQGHVVERAAPFRAAVVTASVEARVGSTPWIRFGHGPAVLAAVLMLGIGVFAERSRHDQPCH